MRRDASARYSRSDAADRPPSLVDDLPLRSRRGQQPFDVPRRGCPARSDAAGVPVIDAHLGHDRVAMSLRWFDCEEDVALAAGGSSISPGRRYRPPTQGQGRSSRRVDRYRQRRRSSAACVSLAGHRFCRSTGSCGCRPVISASTQTFPRRPRRGAEDLPPWIRYLSPGLALVIHRAGALGGLAGLGRRSIPAPRPGDSSILGEANSWGTAETNLQNGRLRPSRSATSRSLGATGTLRLVELMSMSSRRGMAGQRTATVWQALDGRGLTGAGERCRPSGEQQWSEAEHGARAEPSPAADETQDGQPCGARRAGRASGRGDRRQALSVSRWRRYLQ